MAILGSATFENADKYKDLISVLQNIQKEENRILGNIVYGSWTPIGHYRDYSTAEDPIRAKWLYNWMSNDAKINKRHPSLSNALLEYEKYKNRYI